MRDDQPTPTADPALGRPWWKDAVVYQIYPRSFLDTDGDGVGDLPGITAKLDYLKALGVDVVWLSPHFDSPNADNGYDIRDYRKVMAQFGTMADFDAMLAGMSARGMRLIIDLVVNHSSDEHAWFVESRKGRDNPYRDYYIWRDGRDASLGGGPPNNYSAFFGGPAWTFDQSTGQYYLHYFAAKQPDLNWENPKVREEVHDLMRFWLDKGVSGFRMDVIPFISKQPGLPDLTPAERRAPQFVYAAGPKLHDYLREMRREVLDRYDTMTVGEAFGLRPEDARDLIDSRRRELDLVINFDIVRMDIDGWRKTSWTLPRLKALYTELDQAAGPFGWNTQFLSNHDNPRSVSHFGDDDPAWVERSAKVLNTLILTQRGTPFLYQGEELGMTNYPFQTLDDFDDLEVWGRWRDVKHRVSEAEYLANARAMGRDNSRTPMQWTSGPNGGFTSGKPWLPVNPNASTINAEDQAARPGSVLAHTRALIAFRRGSADLREGGYRDIDPDHEQVFAYRRGERLLVLLNFGRETVRYALPDGLTVEGAAFGAAEVEGQVVTLAGWASVILAVRDV
ncbi:oligo-1,6-glucosidase [Caulobacter sp. Root1455]|uniref:alpha-glucosidase n=1 Tax=Caulobacter sp. Root1455 TaxID=1736465 RepID=UPI0006F362C9|nr:alpha-glucosidase [Caulobacter sp. Root1455]KQY95916.1 oligo-1,6-glucosidase [Caulobacter sp. Root1455]